MIILLVYITIVSALICFFTAQRRGLRKHYWCAMGILIGPFAIPFVFLSNPS